MVVVPRKSVGYKAWLVILDLPTRFVDEKVKAVAR
jgi:hypothetical protein